MLNSSPQLTAAAGIYAYHSSWTYDLLLLHAHHWGSDAAAVMPSSHLRCLCGLLLQLPWLCFTLFSTQLGGHWRPWARLQNFFFFYPASIAYGSLITCLLNHCLPVQEHCCLPGMRLPASLYATGLPCCWLRCPPGLGGWINRCYWQSWQESVG